MASKLDEVIIVISSNWIIDVAHLVNIVSSAFLHDSYNCFEFSKSQMWEKNDSLLILRVFFWILVILGFLAN